MLLPLDEAGMTEWMLRKQQLRSGETTKEEYKEWKLNRPQAADDCGRFQPKKEWRKSKQRHEKPSETETIPRIV